MPPFFNRHPFFKNLIKLVGYIVVGYNTLLICLVFPLIILTAIGASLTSQETNTPADTSLTSVYGDGDNQLLSIKINGVIMGDLESESSWFSGLDGLTSGYDIKDQLNVAANDPNIKGVILEIDSPGGTIYGAHAIADGVKDYRDQTGNPVVAFVSGMGASGAYWAAISADKVLADYGSDVGSIGVIMGPFEYYDKVIAQDGGILGGGVVTQNGVEHYNITAGKYKDIGSPYRRLSADELTILQRQVNNEYDNFVQYVSERRGLTAEVIKNQIGALSYDNKTAQQMKLIDGTANREAAYSELARAADIKDDNYSVMREAGTTGFWSAVFGAVTGKPAVQATPSADKVATKLCGITKSTLAYHGSVADLCRMK